MMALQRGLMKGGHITMAKKIDHIIYVFCPNELMIRGVPQILAQESGLRLYRMILKTVNLNSRLLSSGDLPAQAK